MGVLVVLLVFPGGLSDLLYRGRDAVLRRMAIRRGITVASMVADEGGADAPEVVRAAMPSRPSGDDEPVETTR